MRWENYFLQSDSGFADFWRKYLRHERNILYIMGVGFDPRSVVGIENIYGIEGTGMRDVMIARYYKNEYDKKSADDPRVADNLERLQLLINARRCKPYTQKDVLFRSEEDISVTALEAAKIIDNTNEILAYSDIVVDISAMPRSVFIPLLQKLLLLVDAFNDAGNGIKNLHVVVAENASLDGKI